MPAGPEVPEGDAQEQERPVAPEAPVGPETTELQATATRRTSFEVPEADALDQAREVLLDDDDRR
jgi:hypothetical protein